MPQRRRGPQASAPRPPLAFRLPQQAPKASAGDRWQAHRFDVSTDRALRSPRTDEEMFPTTRRPQLPFPGRSFIGVVLCRLNGLEFFRGFLRQN